MKKRILVTGHEGYIGGVMAPYLQQRGYDMVVLDNSYFGQACLFGPPPKSYSTIKKDLRDVTADDLKGIYGIIHLAAICNDPLGNLNADWTYDINHRGSVHLAKMAKAAGVSRFLFSSSCSMHGKSTADMVTEETPVYPLTPYGESKIKAEKDIALLMDETFCPSFMRNGTVYGVSSFLRLDIVLNNLVGWAATTGKIKVFSDGSPWRPVIHVEDVCQAFVAVLESPADVVRNHAFHVGSNKSNYRIRDLAAIVQSIVPGCEIEFSQEEGADQRTYIADFSKLERMVPRFKMKWDAEKGARELYLAFREHGLKVEDMTGNRYIRLNRIRELINKKKLDNTLRWV